MGTSIFLQLTRKVRLDVSFHSRDSPLCRFFSTDDTKASTGRRLEVCLYCAATECSVRHCSDFIPFGWAVRREVPCQNPLKQKTADGGDIAVEWQWKSQTFMEIVTFKGFSIELEPENVKDFDVVGK
jgi:hypothetical protein